MNLRAAEAQAEEIEPVWLPIDYRPGLGPWALRGSLRARAALARARHARAVFLHHVTVGLLAHDLGRSRRPLILSVEGTAATRQAMRERHGLEPQGRSGERLKTSVYRWVLKQAAGFVAHSQEARRSLVEDYGCRDSDIAVIPPAVDPRLFRAGAREHELPRILFVGADFLRKGGDLLLEVFRRRLRGRAELDLVTLDEVPVSPDERDIRVHRGLRPNSPELRRLFGDCDLFALPTRADFSPMACIEAAAAGLPIVASAIGGIPDIVREGRSGHLLPVGDVDGLGDALEWLIADPRRREAMGKAARDLVAAQFDVRKNARRLFEFVAARLAAPRPARAQTAGAGASVA
jgi:glycosyltransferase involved in cell wall biosynthesis